MASPVQPTTVVPLIPSLRKMNLAAEGLRKSGNMQQNHCTWKMREQANFQPCFDVAGMFVLHMSLIFFFLSLSYFFSSPNCSSHFFLP